MKWASMRDGVINKVRGIGALFAALTLAAGLALPAGDAAAQAAETKPKDAWGKRCDQNGRCVIRTEAKDKEGRTLAELLLTRLPQQGLMAEIRSPLGIYIPKGIALAVDGKKRIPIQLITCVPNFCLSAFPVTDEVADAMRKGGKLDFAFIDIGKRQQVVLPFSLIGFTAKLKEL